MTDEDKIAYWQTGYAFFHKKLIAVKALYAICPSSELLERIESLENELLNCRQNLAELGVISVQLPNKLNSSTYMAARNAAIQQVDIAYYGEDFPKRLKGLWDRLKNEPTTVADESNRWLGAWHPDAIRISHEAMLLVRKNK